MNEVNIMKDQYKCNLVDGEHTLKRDSFRIIKHWGTTLKTRYFLCTYDHRIYPVIDEHALHPFDEEMFLMDDGFTLCPVAMDNPIHIGYIKTTKPSISIPLETSDGAMGGTDFNASLEDVQWLTETFGMETITTYE